MIGAPRPRLAAFVLLFTLLSGCVDTGTRDGPSSGTSAHTIEMEDLAFQPSELVITPGSTVTWKNLDSAAHTVTPTDKPLWGTAGSGDDPNTWMLTGDEWSWTFEEEGEFEYYCIPHAALQGGKWVGMVAKIIVRADAPTNPGTGHGTGASNALPPGPARAVDIFEIGRSAFDVPPPLAPGGPTHRHLELTSQEVTGTMANGTTFSYWTFNNTVPGPFLRVRQDDTVTISLTNDPNSIHGHNIDFHAVNGPGGGAGLLNAAPGETATMTFKALEPGLFVYHCAYQDPPLHIAHGMYGLILVEPPAGLPPVDREYYVMQGDFYSPHSATDKGHHEHNNARALSEDPTFVVFNGRMGSLQDPDRRLQADVGDRVRIFVGNGGPGLVSSFHIIGEIFEQVYTQGSLTTPPLEHVQTTLVPAGGAVVVEFEVEVPGDYLLVDHSLFRIHKGALGIMHVDGDDDPDTYRSGP